MIYFTSDQHFRHKNIIKYCERPFATIDDMETAIIKRYNKKVSPNDTVFFVGDFSLYIKMEELNYFLKNMHGFKILIKGNHDRLSRNKYLEAGFDEFCKTGVTLKYKNKSFYVTHRPRYLGAADYVICGHVHQIYKMRDNFINIGVDVWNFCPVGIEEIYQLTQGE